jgi:Glycosyl transferase family 2
MSRLSVVIPTLRRADTFEHALVTVLAQTYADVEIVVQNNGNDPATRAVVERAGDPRVRHFHTDDVLPMTENWERALSNTTGDYVTFIGDDDGLLPDACSIAAQVLDNVAPDFDVLMWEPFLYFWPEFFDEPRRNILLAGVDEEFVAQPQLSHPLLVRFYGFEVHYAKLPMAYNSFIGRGLIERVCARQGRYFIGTSPDVTSGIVNAWASHAFVKLTRPLSVAGLSQHSIGHRMTMVDDAPPQDELERDFPLLADAEDGQALATLELAIAADMLLVQDTFFPDDTSVVFSRLGLVRTVAAAVNDNPSRYDNTVRVIADLVDRYHLDPKAVSIPAKGERPSLPEPGEYARGTGLMLHVIDGARAGLQTISDAVRRAAELVPDQGKLAWKAAPVSAEPPLLGVEPLGFATGGDGSFALVAGWGEQEHWGTWSVQRDAVLRLRLPDLAPKGPRRIGLRYRTIPLPGAPRLVECVWEGRTLHEWSFSASNAAGEVVVDLPPDVGTGVIELLFRNLNARAPSEIGLVQETRLLGIGVEQIRLLPAGYLRKMRRRVR